MASTLPNPADCCVVCCENETVEVPGPAGADGSNGAAGTNGINAFTTITDGFDMPLVGADTASLLVGNSQWMTTTQVVYVENAGYMEVRSKADSTHVVLRNLGYTGNTAPGIPVAGGQDVSPGGLAGVDGADGSNGAAGTNGVNAFTVTTANFTQPDAQHEAGPYTVTIDVGTSLWAAIGQIVFVEDGGYYEVTAVPGPTQITIENLRNDDTGAYPENANSGVVIAFPKDVSPAGIQGPVQNTTNSVVAITYQPAIGDPSPTMAFNAWTTYPLDTLDDPDSIATLVANQFTLEPGTYSVMGALTIDNCQIRVRLQNVTGLGSTVLTSLNGLTDQPMILPMFGAIPVGGGDLFELQYYATNPPGTGTFGGPTTVPALDEAYASLFFTKLDA